MVMGDDLDIVKEHDECSDGVNMDDDDNAAAALDVVGRRTMRRVAMRILPTMFIVSFLMSMDRCVGTRRFVCIVVSKKLCSRMHVR